MYFVFTFYFLVVAFADTPSISSHIRSSNLAPVRWLKLDGQFKGHPAVAVGGEVFCPAHGSRETFAAHVALVPADNQGVFGAVPIGCHCIGAFLERKCSEMIHLLYIC